jgi:hypothetical protein
MGTLVFVCPATGQEVSTGIEMDPATFAGLRREDARCPYCLQLHRLNELRAWIAEDRSGAVPDEGAAASRPICPA